MTSKNIELKLSTRADGEAPVLSRSRATLTRRDVDIRIRAENTSYWITPDRMIIYRDYTLTLDPSRETALRYPTPYGDLMMTVRTKHYKAANERVTAVYDLLTEGKVAETIKIELDFSEE